MSAGRHRSISIRAPEPPLTAPTTGLCSIASSIHRARRSRILGQIKAEELGLSDQPERHHFQGSSQINIHSLIASSLPLLGDLSNNPMIPGSAAYDAAVSASNTTFLSSGIEGIYHSPILGSSGTTPLATVQSYGDISVQPGATITVGNLGYALIAAPNVSIRDR